MGRTSENDFRIAVDSSLRITATNLSDGIVGGAYNSQLAAQGGFGAYRWNLFFGQLPEGLALHETTGRLSGNPMRSNQGNLIFSVSDDAGRVTFRDFPLFISDVLSILTTNLPNGLVGTQYSERIQVTGGKPPYQYVFDGRLPDGLSFNAEQGVISGIPTQGRTVTFEVIVTDASSSARQSWSQDFSLGTTSGLTITTSAVIPRGKQGETVTPKTLEAGGGGGATPFVWEIASGALPRGISLDSQTGALSGTPLDRGDFIFRVLVRDQNGQTSEKEFFWSIAGTLDITTAALPDAILNQSYSFPLSASGGVAPYAWRIVSGSLPLGLTNTFTGVIQGTPAGSQTQRAITIEVNDSDAPAQTQRKTFFISVQDDLFIPTIALPPGRVGEIYEGEIRAELGAAPFEWSISPVLVSGLTLQPQGNRALLQGRPTVAGAFPITVQVSDRSQPSKTAMRAMTVSIVQPLSIVNTNLFRAVKGHSYLDSIRVEGGVLPLRYSISRGSLPDGIRLNSDSGDLTGVTRRESSTFTIRVEDSGLASPLSFVEQEFAIFVLEGMAIATPTVHKALQGSPYQAELQAIGGVSP